jgi:hypothetical protein
MSFSEALSVESERVRGFMRERSEEITGLGYAGPAWKVKTWEADANGGIGLV